MSNAVMPAESVFVEENPGVAHAKRDGGEERSKDAPSAKAAAGERLTPSQQWTNNVASTGKARPNASNSATWSGVTATKPSCGSARSWNCSVRRRASLWMTGIG